MKVRYKHTNIVARDWEALAHFYEVVFGCERLPPERNLAGAWLAQGTGVSDAAFTGVHLRLPGCGADGPTLEIYQYASNAAKPVPVANREGFGHIAFEVEDVSAALEEMIRHGGSALGEVVEHPVPGVGALTFVYAADPEGNIIELQHWA